MNLGSRSFRKPRTGFRNTATRSELDVSGARSPTNILYSLGYCWCTGDMTAPGVERADVIEPGIDDAQLSTNGLVELGIVTGGAPPLPLTWPSTDAATEGDGKVKKQYPGLLAGWPEVSEGPLGTLVLTGSQPIKPQTCFAYSSSIQGSRSLQQSVERRRTELGLPGGEGVPETTD